MIALDRDQLDELLDELLDDVVDDLAPAAGILCAVGLSLQWWGAIARLVMWLQ